MNIQTNSRPAPNRVLRNSLFVLTLAVLFLTGTYIFSPKTHGQTSTRRVLLLSIDGMRPDFYLSSKYDAPKLKALKKNGAYARGVQVIFPSLTYPSHTTLITGVRPDEHGVLSNTIFSPQEGPTAAWYWEADKITAPTLFDWTRTAGLKSASVRWPVTVGAKNIDFLVPEIFATPGYYEGNDFDLTVQHTDPQLMSEIQSKTTLKRYSNEVEQDQWAAEAAHFIWSEKKPNFMTVHLANVDHVEHGYGPNAQEVVDAVKTVDKQISTLLTDFDFNNDCLIVTGDHGFMDVSKRVSPNVLFDQQGWLTTKAGEIKTWEVVAQASGAQAAIYVRNKQLLADVEQLLKKNEKLGYKLLSKSDLQSWGAYPDADFAIVGKKGFTISSTVNGSVVSGSGIMKGQHGFLPTVPELRTGLIMVGCGYPIGEEWELAQSLDIAPTIASILGVATTKTVGKRLQ